MQNGPSAQLRDSDDCQSDKEDAAHQDLQVPGSLAGAHVQRMSQESQISSFRRLQQVCDETGVHHGRFIASRKCKYNIRVTFVSSLINIKI